MEITQEIPSHLQVHTHTHASAHTSQEVSFMSSVSGAEPDQRQYCNWQLTTSALNTCIDTAGVRATGGSEKGKIKKWLRVLMCWGDWLTLVSFGCLPFILQSIFFFSFFPVLLCFNTDMWLVATKKTTTKKNLQWDYWKHAVKAFSFFLMAVGWHRTAESWDSSVFSSVAGCFELWHKIIL